MGGVDTTPCMEMVRFTALPLIEPVKPVTVKPAGRTDPAPTIAPVMPPLLFCESVAVPVPSPVVTDHVPVTFTLPGTDVVAGTVVVPGTVVVVPGRIVEVVVDVGLGGGGLSPGPIVIPPAWPTQIAGPVVQSTATGAVISLTATDPVILTGSWGLSALQRPLAVIVPLNVNGRDPALPPQFECTTCTPWRLMSLERTPPYLTVVVPPRRHGATKARAA